jgi:hypothetical protein
MRNNFVAKTQVRPDHAVHSPNTPTNTNPKSNAGPLDWPNDDNYPLANAPRELLSYTIPERWPKTIPTPPDLARLRCAPCLVGQVSFHYAPCLVGQVSFHSHHHTQMRDERVGELSIVGQTTAELAVSAYVPYDDKITTLRKYGEAVMERAR